jgi:hypothetical protein
MLRGDQVPILSADEPSQTLLPQITKTGPSETIETGPSETIETGPSETIETGPSETIETPVETPSPDVETPYAAPETSVAPEAGAINALSGADSSSTSSLIIFAFSVFAIFA